MLLRLSMLLVMTYNEKITRDTMCYAKLGTVLRDYKGVKNDHWRSI